MNIFMIILKYGGDINRRPWNTVALPHHAFPIRERSRSILAAFASALYKEAASCKAQDAPLTSCAACSGTSAGQSEAALPAGMTHIDFIQICQQILAVAFFGVPVMP